MAGRWPSVITQSGETADTLAALRESKRKGARSVAICNVVGSMATREADGTVYTHAGPEIGVASTKAFTCQLVALYLLAVHLGQVRGVLVGDRGGLAFRCACASAPAAGANAEAGAAGRGRRGPFLHTPRLPVSRPGYSLPHCARRRAEVERNFATSTPRATPPAR